MRSRQGAKGGCRGGLVEGIAALLGSENGSRYRGVSQLQSHQSRCSVQLSERLKRTSETKKDVVFLLTVGSFLLTVELLCLQWCLGAFCLQLEHF